MDKKYPNRACEHIAEDPRSEYDFRRLYTGSGNEYHLVCEACEGENLVDLSRSVMDKVEENGFCSAYLGLPELKERSTELRFETRELSHRNLVAATHSGGEWIGLEPDGRLVALESGVNYARLAPQHFSLEKPLSLSISGDLAFLSPRYGQYAEVFDLHNGDSLLKIDRGSYQIQHCAFPHAFVDHEGETFLIHASDWNKLDITNPRSGINIVERDQGDRLDYFHCQLTVSPDGKRIADDGWVWHPVGVVETWSLERWLESNLFESEDGPTKRALCQRQYLWETAVCWIDNTSLAVWGQGFDEEEMLPAALIFDTESGKETRCFFGPEIGQGGWFGCHDYLFSVSPQSGTSVWDLESGERVLLDPIFKPSLLHQGEFLTWGEKITLSRLVGANSS